jgi:hypothetical protein
MRRFFKFLFILALVCLGFATYSYLGARVTVGRMLGSDPPLTGRTIAFAYQGAPQLPGKQRVWVFSFNQSKLPGVSRAQVFVSVTGGVVATRPRDLRNRLAEWEKSQVP